MFVLKPPLSSRCLTRFTRQYATAASQSVLSSKNSVLESLVLERVKKATQPLSSIISQYDTRAGRILDFELPNESTPRLERRRGIDTGQGVVFVVHSVHNGDRHDWVLCSGFAINTRGSAKSKSGSSIVVTCAHTLEQACFL